MKPIIFLRWITSMALLTLLAGCGQATKEQKEEKQSAEQATGLTLPKKAVPGKELGPVFPKGTKENPVVFTQEKNGFTQANFNSAEGETLALLSVSDLVTNPEALGKYVGATGAVAGYPAVSSGSKGTSILVKQFQVQVRSKADRFSEADRKALLQKFDLAALEKLSKATGSLGQPASTQF